MKAVFHWLAILGLGLGLWLAAPATALAASQDVVLVLDNSGSMRINDPNRLAGKAVTDFVGRLGPDTRVAIIEFATTPTVLMSLTPVDDAARAGAQTAVQKLDYRGQWTDTGAAVERALYELDNHGRSDAQKYIVLMTDGYVDVGNASRDSDKIHWITQSLIPEAVSKHVRVFGIAFTDQADYELLQTLAEKTGAGYYRAYQPGDLSGIYTQINATLANAKAAPQPEEESATPAPIASGPQGFIFKTPLTHMQQVEEQSRRTLWIWIAVLLLLCIIGGAGYYVWSKGGVQALLPKHETAPGPAEGLQAVLYDISNPNDIKRYELGEKSTVIGRVAGYDPEVQYVIAAEPTVGRCHALIERRGHSFWITDQGSINGTFVNGDRVAGDRALKHGDIVSVHRHEFEFVLPELFESESTVLAARDEYGYAEKRQA
ncbi:MAG TPA: VWA domain-containing protein [Gammaproteobacteria bacterium]|nr:VWA domain-containing protein [Gammaproteobacteria bacterium]